MEAAMSNGREVVVVSGVRTAIGDYGGGLKDFAPTDLAARVVRETDAMILGWQAPRTCRTRPSAGVRVDRVICCRA